MSRILWQQTDKIAGLVEGNFDGTFSSNFYKLHRFMPNVGLYYPDTFDLFGKPNIGLFPVTVTKTEETRNLRLKHHVEYSDPKTACLLLAIDSLHFVSGPSSDHAVIGTRFDLAIDFGFPVFNLLFSQKASSGGCDFMLD